MPVNRGGGGPMRCGSCRVIGLLEQATQVLGGGLFTVVACDKIDHNLISLTAKSLFHGAAIPLMQFPTDDQPGIERSL